MDSLEFDLHGLILDQLADTLSIDSGTTNEEVVRLIKRCPELLDDNEGEKEHIITKTLIQNISALASFTANTKCETYVNEFLPILLNYLRYLPIFIFEQDLTWREFSLPDQLSEKLISGLLKIVTKFSQKRDKIFKDICAFLEKLVNQLRCGNVEYICTVILPLLKGFFRAFQSSHLPWYYDDFEYMAHQTQPLVNNDCLQEVKNIIETAVQSSEPQCYYAKKFLSRYQHQGSPLSSNGIILDLVTMMRNMLARAIIASNHKDDIVALMTFKEIWDVLVKNKASTPISLTDHVKKTLRKTYVMSLQYFDELTELLDNLVAQGNDYPSSLYVREIMATSLDLAAIVSVYLHEVDDELISKLTASLFNVPQTPDVKVQKSALDATTLLALNFPEAVNMIQTIRKFLITPSTIFELAVTVERDISILDYAIARLAYCLKAMNQSISQSVIYNLLMILSSGGHDRSLATSKNFLTPSSTMASDQISIHSSVSGISRNEEQRQQMYENIVCAVSGVACILKDDNITTLSVSMLGQRLRNHTPALDTLILEKFVDIALVSPEKVFSEIVQKFDDISRQSLSPENKMVTTAVLKCQLDLASRLSSRPKFYGLYLLKILSLFVEKGVVIQQTVEKNGKFQVTSLAGEIGILLPVLKTLLSHDDFKAHMNAPEELVSLFRNLWFHCVLYGFVSDEAWIREWRDSLVVIAQKTPPLVREATNYLESDLEFNSVLRRGNSDQDLANVRSSLSSLLPNHPSEIKSFSFAEITFLLSVYHIEIMRSQMGQCSFILRYFVNQGINASKLVGCMEEIGNQAIEVFIKECSKRAIAHTINENLQTQVRDLMIATCHRLSKVSQLSIKHLDSLMSAFPSLLCDKKLLFLLLELIELVWQSCEAEYLNEYSPVYTFTSPKVGVSLALPDDYNYRREILSRLCENSKKWITVAMTRAPSEIRGLLENYLAEFDPYQSDNSAHMGRSIAVEIGKAFSKADYNSVIFPRVPSAVIDNVSEFIKDYSARRQFYGQVAGANRWLASLNTEGQELLPVKISEEIVTDQKQKVKASLALLEKRVHDGSHISMKELNSALHLAAGVLISLPKPDEEIIQYIVWIPIYVFTLESLKLATSIWTWVINEKSVVEKRIMIEIANGWIWAIRQRKGLFSPILNVKDPFVNKMQYAPSDKVTRDRDYKSAKSLFGPHLIWLQFLSGRFQAFRYRCTQLVHLYLRFFQITLDASDFLSNHSLSREGRLQILICALKILQSNRMEASIEYKFRTRIFNSAFSWFSLSPRWAYGGNKRTMITEYKLLIEVYRLVENDKVELAEVLTTTPKKYSQYSLSNTISIAISDKNREETTKSRKLLLLFLESELNNLATWSNPLNTPDAIKEIFVSVAESRPTEDSWKSNVGHAWSISPQLAVQMAFRFKQPIVQNELHKLLVNNASEAVCVAEALPLLLGDKLNQNVHSQLKYLLYWAPVPPITAITYFSSTYDNNSLILQYAMRALECHPVDVVFFYIPQIVQALRYDTLGYVERFIMGAAKISQLFAHQIIWNMKANMFKECKDDPENSIADSLKPTLERIIDNIVKSLSGEDKKFYEREFDFFNKVTSISGKLKPYIRKSKLEKKQKIDEEMAKIKVDIGVYLPSNPEGKVVDIDYKSGRPLQSHAKAPFMATFKIRKTRHDSEEVKEKLIHSGSINGDNNEDVPKTIDVWQSAIFKVGDDCRQDVLALQLIAIFKNIFTSVGLDLYLFPYRVVATEPGCGVIDVIPNSISRDQLGREKVNSLYDYFVTTYGGVDSISFQKARICFIQSVAAYSVVSFLLQIKDRHNGNIMLDNEGHIIHIDFGFIFDIAPGGITFESSPFKLTTEMIQVMGGRADVQQFKWFSELCIKAYLASRPYAEQIVQCVALMLGSGLPCFKGDTLRRLRDRFQLDKTERRAADFMIEKINQSFENKRTVWYDSFQKATNGIPY